MLRYQSEPCGRPRCSLAGARVYEERLTELSFLLEEGRESCCLQLPEGMCQENRARSSSEVQHKKFIRNIYKLECGKLQVNVRRERMLLRDLKY